SQLVSAIRRLSLDDANILVVQPSTVQVQQSTVSHFGRMPDHVLDGSARIPFVLLATDGKIAASGIATGSASFRAAVDPESATLVWTPIDDVQTNPSATHPSIPSWLKAAAAAIAGFVLIAAFSLPLVVLDLGPATDTPALLDHNFRAESLTAGSAWEIGILLAPLIAALLALAVWSGPRAWVVVVAAFVVTAAAGAAQAATEGWGMSHLIVWGVGAYVPALLLLIAAFIESKVGPPVSVIERFRRSIG
uniref:hypothetical protein n=1 Tax=Pseudolysinimonas sp. TaxID=2680009 RepID=UPI00286B9739